MGLSPGNWLAAHRADLTLGKTAILAFSFFLNIPQKRYFCVSLRSNYFIFMGYFKQEGQVALNPSPEFCLKLTYWYLLKAGHDPGDTWDGANFGPGGII